MTFVKIRPIISRIAMLTSGELMEVMGMSIFDRNAGMPVVGSVSLPDTSKAVATSITMP